MSTANPPGDRQNPRRVKPDNDPALHPNRRPQVSLAESLGSVVDDARQLLTDFGMRPYRVFSIVVEWSGGEVGKGTAKVVCEKELLPTPKVSMSGVSPRMTSGGLSERGTVRMTGISPRYTQEDITSLFHQQPVPENLDAFIEVRMDERDGEAIRRRFYPLTPTRRPEKMDWAVDLRRQNQNEHRDTSVDNLPRTKLPPIKRDGDMW